MVAAHGNQPGQRRDARERGAGIGAVTDEVAKTNITLRAEGGGTLADAFERFEIAVDIGKDGGFHDGPSGNAIWSPARASGG